MLLELNSSDLVGNFTDCYICSHWVLKRDVSCRRIFECVKYFVHDISNKMTKQYCCIQKSNVEEVTVVKMI